MPSVSVCYCSSPFEPSDGSLFFCGVCICLKCVERGPGITEPGGSQSPILNKRFPEHTGGWQFLVKCQCFHNHRYSPQSSPNSPHAEPGCDDSSVGTMRGFHSCLNRRQLSYPKISVRISQLLWSQCEVLTARSGFISGLFLFLGCFLLYHI